MKTKFSALLLMISLAVFFSCNDSDTLPKETKKTSKKFLKVKEGTARIRSIIGKSSSSKGVVMQTLSKKGKTRKQVAKNNTAKTCGTLTETTGPNNSIIVTIDYGTGCEEDGLLLAGKIITTFSEENGTVLLDKVTEEFKDFSITYEYCEEVDANGDCVATTMKKETVTMNGTVVYTSNEANTTNDSSFTFEENLTLEFSDGETITSKSNYSETETDDSLTITEGKGMYTGKNFEYTYEIFKPVVYKYSCDTDVFMPVSGIEKDSYKGLDANGQTEQFDYEIDYGKGECDNKATVTENGVTKEIDFGS